MWTCIKCSQQNEDQYTVCPHCGASRSVGRFGTPQTPRNAAAYSAPVQNNIPVPPAPQQAPQVQYVADFSHVRAGKGYMVFGALLSLLSAAFVIVLAVLRHADWADALDALLRPARAEGEKIPFLVNYLLYALLALLAALTAALPGLWTLGLGKLLRRLNRMEELL